MDPPLQAVSSKAPCDPPTPRAAPTSSASTGPTAGCRCPEAKSALAGRPTATRWCRMTPSSSGLIRCSSRTRCCPPCAATCPASARWRSNSPRGSTSASTVPSSSSTRTAFGRAPPPSRAPASTCTRTRRTLTSSSTPPSSSSPPTPPTSRRLRCASSAPSATLSTAPAQAMQGCSRRASTTRRSLRALRGPISSWPSSSRSRRRASGGRSADSVVRASVTSSSRSGGGR
mmetsp:Transcript_31043/g.91149  ORF Transcript_31043/g.91149 Transcript_31043/m.91149 type:complete len:230 (+) Transcript_31043:1297-1986(+)